MSFGPTSLRIWPVTPCWESAVRESLEWETDVMRASATGVSQHRGLRIGPQRSLSFEVLSQGQERSVVDMLLGGHRGVWHLPFWPDVQWLTDTVTAGAEEVPCATTGFDFVVGGKALLYGSVNRWVAVEVASIEADHITLADPLPVGFGRGDRLYPLRRARVQQGAEERMKSLGVSRRRLAFDIDEPCDWPELVDPTMYLTHPVLDVWPDESDDPSSSYQRLLQSVTYTGARPFEYDLADQAFRMQRTQWLLTQRPMHTWFRSLVYTLQGRRVPMWLPSFASDLQAAGPIAGGSTSLPIQWAAYSQFGAGRHNRKDLRIELDDGAVFYRRIVDADETGDEIEALTLSSSLDDGAIAPERIRSIGFMALSTLASDSVEIEHITDQEGTARSTLGWQAEVPDA